MRYAGRLTIWRVGQNDGTRIQVSLVVQFAHSTRQEVLQTIEELEHMRFVCFGGNFRIRKGDGMQEMPGTRAPYGRVHDN